MHPPEPTQDAAPADAESLRLEANARREADWKRWGTYLSERQWGTVREDYSPGGDAWGYLPHDHARSRAYRWGEDGLLGLCDRQCRVCFAIALWNGRDPILKERLFGLSGPEGNHGEDVKECYFYLDATPTGCYAKALYKYPQAEFPYARLLEENRRRGKGEGEFEILDTGIFDDNRYFDVFVEYAKASPNDVLIRITAANRGPEAATLHLLPTLWLRNTWSWGRVGEEGYWPKGTLTRARGNGDRAVTAIHPGLGQISLAAEEAPAEILFTENETNAERLFGAANTTPYVKDAFHRYLIGGEKGAVNPAGTGTKSAMVYRLEVPAGGEAVVRLRMSLAEETPAELFGPGFDATIAERIREADEHFARFIPPGATEDGLRVARQAAAGLVWSRQYYFYVVKDWLEGDPSQPPPPASRLGGRNAGWKHLHSRDVVSMPDKWEYPWWAAWDLAFHMLPFAKIDPEFAKEQLILMLREWYMHPNGQLPAYEWSFDDVNPPVHAWACWRVYKISAPRGQRDRLFLERAFQKLLMTFTWWVNRKDAEGNHLFGGGFLGLDNIGVFDRSRPLPGGATLEQADGTAWMAFFCITMLAMALELARKDPAYEDVASKFFEHFVAISDAMNRVGGQGLWDEEDGFYYDQMLIGGQRVPLRVRSAVGVIPLFAVSALAEDVVFRRLPGFAKRMRWFLRNRQDLAKGISFVDSPKRPGDNVYLLAIPSRERLVRVLRYVLDENELLSPHGIRSLSRVHRDHPFELRIDGEVHRVEYVPGESQDWMFGGNSNWRGPVWFPLNYLLIEALERYHHFYHDTLKVECPTGSGVLMTLDEVATELRRRLARLFVAHRDGTRACHGGDPRFAQDPHWKNLLLFHEYFHGDTGKGLGADHQTGWTALVVLIMNDLARERAGAEAAGRLAGSP
ncbi:MAG TPA: glucosidase [Thermoanaerobaculia bacterium]|nr:glucosidase [Thermoanaerobaculia bacterium]